MEKISEYHKINVVNLDKLYTKKEQDQEILFCL